MRDDYLFMGNNLRSLFKGNIKSGMEKMLDRAHPIRMAR